jgi:hypothetical protein
MIQNTYQVDTKNPNWFRWKSKKKNNYFAPDWDVSLWIEDLDVNLISSFFKIVTSKEELYENNKWQHYNIFSWKDSEVTELKSCIKKCHHNFLTALNLDIFEEVWIRGWIFPQKKGQDLPIHNHAIHQNSYLSGNIILSDNKITTDFQIPYLYPNIDCISIENKPGRITLFPSYLPHKVDILLDETRYSLGFDIITNEGLNYLSKNSNTFDDPLFLSVLL